MKSFSKYLFIFILLSGCTKNVTNLNEIIQEKRLQILLNEFAKNVKIKKENNNIYITGIIGKNPNILEISFYNQKPVYYTDKNMEELNSYLKFRKFGIFKYKGITFFVTDDLRQIFKLNYKNFDAVKNNFDEQDIPKPTDYYSMFINFNKKDLSIIYYSNLSKESLKWKNMQ